MLDGFYDVWLIGGGYYQMSVNVVIILGQFCQLFIVIFVGIGQVGGVDQYYVVIGQFIQNGVQGMIFIYYLYWYIENMFEYK